MVNPRCGAGSGVNLDRVLQKLGMRNRVQIVGFAVGATHWLARRMQVSPLHLNRNLTLNPSAADPREEIKSKIKLTSKTEPREATA